MRYESSSKSISQLSILDDLQDITGRILDLGGALELRLVSDKLSDQGHGFVEILTLHCKSVSVSSRHIASDVSLRSSPIPVSTSPGEMDRNNTPLLSYSAWNLDTTMFIADLLTVYGPAS